MSGEIIDRVEALLEDDRHVPAELAAELLVALPAVERERWLALALRFALDTG